MPAPELRVQQIRDDDGELFCPACGYSLRGIASERCPECGLSIDRATISRSIIPWSHREHIGRVNALLKTIHLGTRRPSALAKQASRPVRFRDAQLFRWLV